MLARLIAWSMRNAWLVLGLAVALAAGGLYALRQTPLDALPDLSDVQVIVHVDAPGQAPQVVEDQITYPLASAMLAVPRAKVVRGFSNFGASFVYVIFEDGTDLYWARSRVLEALAAAADQLPAGVTPTLGPDATGVGWVYQYVLESDRHSLEQLRTLQDWSLRYPLTAAQGVAEVASLGGFVRQYSVTVDPVKLREYGIPLARVNAVIAAGNRDVGGRTLELSETEYMLRGRGYLRGIADLENLVLKADAGTPVLIRDVARVELVPDERRGIAELDGKGEAVGGIVIARQGENARAVIESVKAKLAELRAALPEGVQIRSVYDRSQLIERAIGTLRSTLLEECLIVALVCMLFLFHVRSALVAIVMLPLGVLVAFIAMRLLGISSNIMSLGGIAIAIGAMVDAAIVMIENAHKHLERDGASGKPRLQILIDACREVGPALFFSLLIITVSFLPVFALEAQEGRLFKPLAYTKTFAMAGAALLSVTLVPALMLLFVRGRIVPETENPVNRLLLRLYRPIILWVLRHRWPTLLAAGALLLLSLWPAARLGSEFMPTLHEGTLLYMPTTLPGLSVTQAQRLLQQQDRILRTFPEVASVFGKAGRAETATDPAPLEMFETTITLKPEDQWRPGMTVDALVAEMDRALQFPGVANSWTMPIKARTDMLSTGIRTPIGIKVLGNDLGEIERMARQVEAAVRRVPGTTSAYAERLSGGYYIDVQPDLAQLARYGVGVGEVQDVIASALGGARITTLLQGRERFGVIVRYPRELRDTPERIANQVLVATPDGAQVPLGELATLKVHMGPPSIRSENAQLAAYVYVDTRNADLGDYVQRAQRAVAGSVQLPAGVHLEWSGQYENMQRAQARMQVVVPVTLALIFLLLYLNFRRVTESLIVMLSVPFALIGGIWLLWLLDYQLSVAVAVGFIALAGVAAETGVVMLLYLDQALREIQARRQSDGLRPSHDDLQQAIITGAVERVRPKMMTVVAIMAGLLPIMWSHGTGAEVMRRIAAPMVGGMVSSTLLTLVVIPVIYAWVKERQLSRRQ